MKDISAAYPEKKIINCSSAQEAVVNADIIATATPSKEAIIMHEWLKPGVHINAFGCDTEGKQELDPKIFTQAKVFVDSLEECVKRGESQHALKQGLIQIDHLAGEVGEISLGKKSGRDDERQITVFDAVGLSIQDITAAVKIWHRAEEINAGVSVPIS